MILRKFSYEELNEKPISFLRDLGRAVGVKSSANRAKGELIQQIMAIQSGELEPSPRSKRGAPPKMEFDFSPYCIDAPQDKTLNNGKAVIVKEKIKDISEEQGYNYNNEESVKVCDHEYTFSDLMGKGVLEITTNGYGFLRDESYLSSKNDVFVSQPIIKKYNLKRGDKIEGVIKIERKGDSPSLQTVTILNDEVYSANTVRKNFDELTPYYPTRKIYLETDDENDVAKRCIDLFAPIGFGQRGLIVAPPKVGKTTLIKKLAQSIEKNHPSAKLIVLLIDERPEEVTDIRRSVKSEVIASTFDEGADRHIRVAELVISRAKRLVERDKDVVILLDSITRLTRAYNEKAEGTGKTLSGGLDPSALTPVKKFFGTARNIDDGGSLTIISTALIETGSRMDDVIYEEFKGTGNMEIFLSKNLAEKRVFPAIDLYKSGTRKDELLLTKTEHDIVYELRRILGETSDATERILETMQKTSNNGDFLKKAEAYIKIHS